MEKWKDLSIKDKIAIVTAVVAFIIGWGLSIAGFVVPPLGEIANSVLFVLGQALVYAASVFGIAGYFSSETARLKRDVKNMIDEEEKRYKNETEINP